MNEAIILMYHGTPSVESRLPAGREPGAEIYDVPLVNFSQQMKYLQESSATASQLSTESEIPWRFTRLYFPKRQEKKYCVTTLSLTKKEIEKNGRDKAVIITFDDGEASNFDEAFPVLKACGFPAYFFVTVSRIGQPGYMSWEQLEKLCAAGMIVGSHGLNHKILVDLPQEELMKELSESKRILEDNLKREITDFSVPRGFYDSAVLTFAIQAGYRHIFVSQKNTAVNLAHQCFDRLALKGNWSLPRFAAALDGHLPWQERCREYFLQSAKTILGRKRYNAARTALLRFYTGKNKLPLSSCKKKGV